MGKVAGTKKTAARTTRTTQDSSRTLRENPKKEKNRRKKRKEKLKQQILDESDDNFFDVGETSFSEEGEDDETILRFRAGQTGYKKM